VLATFVIGLREGLEASLIIGIIAAFLGRQGRRDALRQVWVGVAAAVAICVAIAIILRVVAHDLPGRGQDGLETVIGFLAVAMVTSMIVWMRSHARQLKGQLEGSAAAALAAGSASALVAMAFLAVLREGFDRLGLNELIAVIHPENERSRRVATKLGMRPEVQVHNPVLGREVDIWQITHGAGIAAAQRDRR